MGFIGPSKDEEKVKTLSHTQLSLLFGDQHEVVPEQERDEQDEQKDTAVGGGSITWWSQSVILFIRKKKMELNLKVYFNQLRSCFGE